MHLWLQNLGLFFPVTMMNTKLSAKAHFNRLLRDRGGNFGVMTAIMIPVLLGAAGVAIDVSDMLLSQRQLQEATDSAALATATALVDGKVANHTAAEALAKDFVSGQIANYLSDNQSDSVKSATTVGVTETTNGSSGKTYSVSVTTSYAMPVSGFMSVFGYNTINIAASSSTISSSSVSETKDALSMVLALDKSGSMLLNTDEEDGSQYSCIQYYERNGYLYQYPDPIHPCYIKKIAALKTAANMLLDQLDKADPDKKYIRTGAIAWSSQIDIKSALSWGTANTRSKVINKLEGNGGTESSAAMKEAYNRLRASKEAEAQAKNGNTTFTKYIVLMTDGENNAASSDTETKKWCTAAKDEGMQIYTVAFMAPTRGQQLLQACATSTSMYFKAENMEDLVAAFKSIGQKASKQTTRLTQ